MCQPKRWLWGLLPLALLWIAAGLLHHDSIQTDLTTRSVNEALKAKAPWATAAFDGRDATVTGVSPTPAAQRAPKASAGSKKRGTAPRRAREGQRAMSTRLARAARARGGARGFGAALRWVGAAQLA